MMYTNTTKGYSLVETLVAISVLLIAIVSPLTIVSKSIQTSRYIEETTTALFLAQEGIEAVVWARNEETIIRLNNSTPDRTWYWVANRSFTPWYNRYNSCYNNTGCNVTFEQMSGDPFYAANSTDSSYVYNCSDLNNCGLLLIDEDPTKRGRYVHDTSGNADFYRRITFDDDAADQLTVTVEVFWESDSFSDMRSVELQTVLFDIYGQ